MSPTKEKLLSKDLSLFYGEKQALERIHLSILERQVTAVIGPSGCGKSTFLRCLNRLNELNPRVRIEGEVLLDGQNIYSKEMDVVQLRKKVGMVFQKPNPFPKTIYENIAYGLRINGVREKSRILEIVERSLIQCGLWEEVKDRLFSSALELSGGQQQRLCIARAISIEPEVLLMDEPCSALDPIATYRIEELIDSLKEKYTIVLVTHSMQQAARVSDYTAFFYLGKLIEYGPTKQIFTNPQEELTESYITGRFG